MQRTRWKSTAAAWALAALWALAASPQQALAGQDDGWLEPADWRRWLQTQEIGRRSRDFRDPEQAEAQAGPTHLKRRLSAGALSLVVPGAGQLYNGQQKKALIMLGVEAAVWGTYLGFDRHADMLSEDYRNWAGIYAGTVGAHPDTYWQAVGRFNDSDAWYDARLRQARAFSEPVPDPPAGDQRWQWRSLEHRRQYQDLRADANQAYDRRNKMLLFAILNRAISAYDAVRSGGAGQSADGSAATGLELGPFDLTLEVAPVMRHAGARAMVAWSF